MAYYNNNNQYPRQQQGRPNYGQQPAPEIRALPLPEDYVDAAEAVVRQFEGGRTITTSKLRNLLSLVTDVYNVENLRDEPELLPDSKAGITMMRIRFVYEAGRDPATKEFITKAKLLEYIKDIKSSREKLIAFAHYMEALVAYHRFLIGGKEG